MLRLLTPSREGGKPTRPQQITDENQTALPDWESVKHDFVHGDWSQRRIALAHGVSGRTLAARSGAVLFPGLSQLCTLRLPAVNHAARKVIAAALKASAKV